MRTLSLIYGSWMQAASVYALQVVVAAGNTVNI